MNQYRIPFNKVTLMGNELNYMEQAINDGHVSGDGSFSKRCQAQLQEELGVKKVL